MGADVPPRAQRHVLRREPVKRSPALDFTRRAGKDALLRLTAGADVFVQSCGRGRPSASGSAPRPLRPQPAARRLLDRVRTGRAGPRAGEPGYDPLIQAAAGIMSLTGEPERPGCRSARRSWTRQRRPGRRSQSPRRCSSAERTGHGCEVDPLAVRDRAGTRPVPARRGGSEDRRRARAGTARSSR